MAFWKLPLSPHLQLLQWGSPKGPLPISVLQHRPLPLPLSLPWGRGTLLKESNLLQRYLYIVFIMFRFALTNLVDCLVQELHVLLVQLSHVSGPVHSFSPLAPVHSVSPLRLSQFQAELVDHPDQAAVAYVLNGLRDGFILALTPYQSPCSLPPPTCALLSFIHLSLMLTLRPKFHAVELLALSPHHRFLIYTSAVLGWSPKATSRESGT